MKNKITLLATLLLCTLFSNAQISYAYDDPEDNYGDGTKNMIGQREYRWDIDTLNWDDIDSFNMQYNGQDRLVARNYLIPNTTISGPWKNNQLSLRQYDVSGNLQLQVDSSSNPTIGDRYEFTYNNNNLEIQKLHKIWNSTSANWHNLYRYSTTYTGFDAVNVYLTEVWLFVDQAWQNSRRVIHSYNTQNLDSIITTENWNTGTSQWDGIARTLYTYDGNGNITISIYEEFDAGFMTYKPKRKYESFYDGSNRETDNTEYAWNGNTNVWEPAWKYQYTYNAAGKRETWMTKKWNSNNSVWDNLNLVTYTYDANSRSIQDFYQSWTNNVWSNQNKATYTRDANGYIIRFLAESWNVNTLAWRSYSAIDYWYGPRITSDIAAQMRDVVNVYPNPSNGPVVFVNAESNLPYAVYDIAGRLVKQGQLQPGTNTIILNDAKGIYLLRAGNGTAKLVKE